ncbi:MAG: Jag N-terminal domain-containing protein [Caldimicrobium sp.]
MSKILELEGKSLDQMVEKACQDLGCLPEDLKIEILEYTSGGMLGSSKKIKANFMIKPDKILSERATRALSFLKELFYHMDFQIETQTQLLGEKMEVDIIFSGPDTRYLLQNEGEPLSALEYLTNKIVAKALGVGPKINLKVRGVDLEREKRLVKAVERALELIKEDKKERAVRIGNKREERLVLNRVKDEPNIAAEIQEDSRGKKVVLRWKEA